MSVISWRGKEGGEREGERGELIKRARGEEIERGRVGRKEERKRVREGGTESWKSESKARFTIMLHCPTMPCRVAKCHEDRNGFHPRDAAKPTHIVNLSVH